MRLLTARRLPRWSLRSLLVVITLLGIWLGYQWNWIHQRREALKTWYGSRLSRQRAPGGLWLFGEPGYAYVVKSYIHTHDLSPEEIAEWRHVERLFPEATALWLLPSGIPSLDELPEPTGF